MQHLDNIEFYFLLYLIILQEEAEVGIVEKVVLQHFMCHKYLEMNFGSNVNFIIGRNGSKFCVILS